MTDDALSDAPLTRREARALRDGRAARHVSEPEAPATRRRGPSPEAPRPVAATRPVEDRTGPVRTGRRSTRPAEVTAPVARRASSTIPATPAPAVESPWIRRSAAAPAPAPAAAPAAPVSRRAARESLEQAPAVSPRRAARQTTEPTPVPPSRRSAREHVEDAPTPPSRRAARDYAEDVPAASARRAARAADPAPTSRRAARAAAPLTVVPDLPQDEVDTLPEAAVGEAAPLTRRSARGATSAAITVAPLSRRAAKASQQPAGHGVAGPVAPAVTAAVLLLTATAAAATSNGVDAISGKVGTRTPASRPTTDAVTVPPAPAPVPQDLATEMPLPPAPQPVGTPTVGSPTAAVPTISAPSTAPVARDQARSMLIETSTAPAPSPTPVSTPTITVPAQRWVKPVGDYYISSGYGWRWGRLHAGIDYAGAANQPIRSLGAGTVIDCGYEELRGNAAYVQLEDGTVIVYAHMNRLDVHTGMKVQAGQQLGLLGSTGNSTGPHLHLEVHPHNGEAIDPVPWLTEHGIF